jgi:hypothetical protein
MDGFDELGSPTELAVERRGIVDVPLDIGAEHRANVEFPKPALIHPLAMGGYDDAVDKDELAGVLLLGELVMAVSVEVLDVVDILGDDDDEDGRSLVVMVRVTGTKT